ncbi:hypothetical protein [Actinoplanes sp. NPDC026670]|uniref:hypothetical protein n=1 Tax=Actinoplanes sp. NPDC026670 TaxID=3154700 RepID=UPI0033D0E969
MLTRPFDAEQAPHRGVIVTTGTTALEQMITMVEKPDPTRARQLIDQHGADRLRLLEGRFKISPELLTELRHVPSPTGCPEPRLSTALAMHARTSAVRVVTTGSLVIDLGRQGNRAGASVTVSPGRPATLSAKRAAAVLVGIDRDLTAAR